MARAMLYTSVMSTLHDMNLAEAVDTKITKLAGPEATGYGLLMALRSVICDAATFDERVSQGAAGLIIDVLHAQCEDWLRRETE